ncbi:uncharacterized protein LOC105294453 isoform X3 [Pteropus vampyrus]|uniref:Uncharacterized protein LOC105294453 isoform X3 n=1 Tax=Pteropus vampyrus TaxID=132908 RepID=A0A6P6CLT9_PTEVA|nr:uncharacterized protein LOC105294453 isoform X3 [Pteropus vampyrus]
MEPCAWVGALERSGPASRPDARARRGGARRGRPAGRTEEEATGGGRKNWRYSASSWRTESSRGPSPPVSQQPPEAVRELNLPDIPQNMALIHYIGDILLNGLNEQEEVMMAAMGFQSDCLLIPGTTMDSCKSNSHQPC